MNTDEIGAFLAQLRKNKGMTQEQLGEYLGVSNKTVSRWETGTYLPPVEMLQQLSLLHDITINEILAAKRLTEEQFQAQAEETVVAVLKNSPFTLGEKVDFFEGKWEKEHLAANVAGLVLLAVLVPILAFRHMTWAVFASMGTVLLLTVRYNEKMTYIEEHAYDGKGSDRLLFRGRNRALPEGLRKAGLALLVLTGLLGGMGIISEAAYGVLADLALLLELLSILPILRKDF